MLLLYLLLSYSLDDIFVIDLDKEITNEKIRESTIDRLGNENLSTCNFLIKRAMINIFYFMIITILIIILKSIRDYINDDSFPIFNFTSLLKILLVLFVSFSLSLCMVLGIKKYRNSFH